MKHIITIIAAGIVAICAGCSTAKAITDSASGKNLDLSGYVMLGEIETANPETGTPQGKMILGRVTYKSRKVGIPADQKVPNSGNFRATKSTSLFGAQDVIIEYDWTAGSEADAAKAEETLQKMKEKAEKEFDNTETEKANNVKPSTAVEKQDIVTENSAEREKTTVATSTSEPAEK